MFHKVYNNITHRAGPTALAKNIKYLHKQQTPNPDAHVPEAVPPNFEQSDEL